VGAVLPGGADARAQEDRGVESNGMLCSAKELGLGADHAGILELDTCASATGGGSIGPPDRLIPH